MTALAMNGDRELCLEAGMNDYLSKPVQPSELRRAIEKQVAETSRLSQPATALGKPLVQNTVFDKSALLERLGGNEELFAEVVGIFLKDMPVQLKALKDALNANDAETVWKKAHRIKGASANIGAHETSDVALAIERSGRKAELHTTADLVEKLEQAFGKLQREISLSP
jgi:HPt (histidine-containing phosphotransfer) domain-containing protein